MDQDKLNSEQIKRRIESKLLYSELFNNQSSHSNKVNIGSNSQKIISAIGSKSKKIIFRIKNYLIVKILRRINLTTYGGLVEANETISRLKMVISERDKRVNDLLRKIDENEKYILELKETQKKN